MSKHHHPDPDLKIFAIAVIGICAIVFGPAIMAALWVMALAAGIGMGLAAIGLVAVIAHNLGARQPRYLPPPPPPPPLRQPSQRREIAAPVQRMPTADEIADALIRKHREGR